MVFESTCNTDCWVSKEQHSQQRGTYKLLSARDNEEHSYFHPLQETLARDGKPAHVGVEGYCVEGYPTRDTPTGHGVLSQETVTSALIILLFSIPLS